MNIAELRVQLHQAIDTITDEVKLEAIYTSLEEKKGPFDPMSLEEYADAIDQSRQQIMDGNYLSADDFEKDSEGW